MSTILHVEDESSVRFLYKEVFEELGYEVLQASSGKKLSECFAGSGLTSLFWTSRCPAWEAAGFWRNSIS